jgi:uncharacterized OB-fold protein
MARRIESWKGKISLEYRYTAGVAGERFFSELKKGGRLMATRCDDCKVTYLPPRIYCERCLSPLEKWVEVSGPASLYSYTVTHQSGKAFVVGLAKFKGVEGGILAPVAPSKRKLKIGSPVKIVNKRGKLEISL